MCRALTSFLVLLFLMAGLPAAVDTLGGPPVPRRLPSWHQVTASLARPDNGMLFLGVVRWVSWLAWAVFAVCVLAELAARLRGRSAWRLPAVAPFQALASALVGSMFLGLLSGPSVALSAAPVPRIAVTVSAQVPAGSPGRILADSRYLFQADAAPASARTSARGGMYVVVEGDNLWEIAAHFLGDGERWQEIFALNRGRPQPDGRQLTNPNLILPGWVLALPPPSAQGAHPRDRLPSARTGPQPVRHHGTRPSPGTRRPAAPGPPHRPRPVHQPAAHPHRQQRPAGIGLPGGGLVGITLAAAISTALVTWRLHKRRTATPTWPSPPGRSPLRDIPASIRALRRAHLRSLAAETAEAHGELSAEETGSPLEREVDDGDGLDEFGAPAGDAAHHATSQPEGQDGGLGRSLSSMTESAPVSSRHRRAASMLAGESGPRSVPRARPLPPGTVVFGIRGREEIPLADVARPVLGLTGPGAYGAARALMIGVLAASRGPAGKRAKVVIPAADARLLTGRRPTLQMPGVTAGWPDGLAVTPSLAEALDLVSVKTARRRQQHRSGTNPPPPAEPTDAWMSDQGTVVLIATTDSLSFPRVLAALGTDSAAGITAILLGEPPASTSCHVGADGMILAASVSWLAGVQATHLSAADAVAMLSLLRGADGHVTSEPSGPGTRPDDHQGISLGRGHPGAPRLRAGGSASAALPDAPASRERASRPPAPRDPDWSATPVPEPPANASAAQQSATLRPGEQLSVGAGRAGDPSAYSAPVTISVLGPLRISVGESELTGGLRKARELLAYLAVHPGGVTGERISADLWPDLSTKYAASQRKLALRKAREMLRTATALAAQKFITLTGDRYQLDPSLISVDMRQFDAALDSATAAISEQDQLTALRQATALYRGPLADGAGYDWAEYHAEPARRRAVDALARTAAILQPGQPEDALRVLETAITHDPYNEAVYQTVIRIQGQLGRSDAARRTLALLETRLAALGLGPAASTREAAGMSADQGAGPAADDRGARTARLGTSGRAVPGGSSQRPSQGRHRR